ncbi:MAG TPA: ribosome biogenesis factor YjgA [Polyangiaceae bacterium]|nr:ribosome biogenesis factor YjgA [Polyangiaceae bacterium]
MRKPIAVLPDGTLEEQDDLTSRTELRAERKRAEAAWMDFAKTLITISERQLLRLELSEDVLRVIQDTRLITSPTARGRGLRLIRQELRGLELSELRDRLEDLSHPSTRARKASTPADEWRKRLLDGGEAEFAEFLAQYARAERQHLRTLLRNARSAPAASKNKALSALTQALRDAMSAG